MCVGVVLFISGNKETLDLVKLQKTSSNRGLFLVAFVFNEWITQELVKNNLSLFKGC